MTDDYIERQGRALVAHRLRRSSDRIVDQIGALLRAAGLLVPPRGASMLLLIDEQTAIGIVEASRRLRLSHPLIVRMARQFEELGLVTIHKDPVDSRRKQLVATERGRAEAQALRAFNVRTATVFGDLFAEIGCDVVALLDRLDAALDASSIEQRLSRLTQETNDER